MTSSAGNQSPADPEAAGYEKIPGERYAIVSRLGYGAFGSVYRASDTFLNRSVAVKSIRLDTSLDPEQRKALNKRFIREAQVAAQLQHANIVTIHDIMFTPGTGFIVMEYIEGSTLQDLLEESEISLSRAVDIVTQVAKALDYAHAHNVIHRDIKPANIMITPAFEAKITDFGIAKAEGATHLTQSGSLVGTPDYMSPEQAKGEEVDVRSDLFSLGCVLYECASGEKPFSGGNLTGVLLSIVNTNPLESEAWKRRGAPPELERVLERALAKSPDDRFENAASLLEALQSIPHDVLDGTGTVSVPETIAESSPERAPEAPTEALPPITDDQLKQLRDEEKPLSFKSTLSDELQQMSLTPAQGYILSLIDGSTRARDILSLTPMPENEVAATIHDLIGKGLLSLGEDQPAAEAEANVVELDPAIVIAADRILHLGTERRYSELLGIDISTSTADVKKAYLELVQRFHPDAQEGRLSEPDRRKLARVCAVATEALDTVSGRAQPQSPPPEPEPMPSRTEEHQRQDLGKELFKRAINAYEITDYWEAIQLSRQAIELDEENPQYHLLLGHGLMKNKNWVREAEESLRRAHELDPRNAEALEALAQLYESDGKPELAAKMTEKVKALEVG